MLPSEDIAVRAAASPAAVASVPPQSSPGSLAAPHLAIPLRAVHGLIAARLLKPGELALLGRVELAPGIIVDASLLGWHRGLLQIVYRCPNGGIARLDRVSRLLHLGGDDAAWSSTAMPNDRERLLRPCLALGTTLYVYEEHVPAFGKDCADGTLLPTGRWIATSAYDEYRLVDLGNPDVLPVFASAEDAMAAADAAVLGDPLSSPPDIVDGVRVEYDPDRYYWLHRAVPASLLSVPGAS